MNKKDIEELIKYNLAYMEAETNEEIFGGNYTSDVELEYSEKYIERLEQENKQQKGQLIQIRNNNEELKRRIKLIQDKRDSYKFRYIDVCRKLKQRDKVITKAIDKIQLLIDIGFDYDGFNQVDSLKTLIDELIGYAKESRHILQKCKGDNK